ncbi:serine/threonine protein kinase [Streptomyces sp. A3M-1-3]|uniref:serine/threonine-protein kinase n=1 Tax=Streptomyces sp. A3M-1-3 TaxID=2962044 RepID=UPI0020B86E4A|nr:serine/threonine-protein kinase [Streptomyces sp. A3M-1-3]MCP3820614.1 serine/threonine protein kinase [Streptomyces sp. A3M-1-3]
MDTWSVPGYTETRELGSGGSGRVVLAVHDATGIPVAVKYLSERMRRDTAFVREFRAEAQLLGGLDTPHVVRLYEYVEAPDGAAIVMELVDGIALRTLLSREGRTDPEPALVVLKGSLLGLAAAHRAGVVHRDYKPENVLVAADGSSKLVDFGIAAGRGTTPGVAGTPAYMAPEQWSGEPASPAADVYAATATFFECLTGRKPFSGENFAELALQHISAPVPEEEAPEPVRPLIRRGLAKTPEERPANAAAFVAELEELASAAYGPDWEERGQRKLAALAALLPSLFPSAGTPPAGTTAVATTSLGRGHRLGGGPWPGRQGALAGALALILGMVLAISAQATDDGAGQSTAQAVATTSALPGDAGAEAGSPTAGPSATVSPSPAESASSAEPSEPTGPTDSVSPSEGTTTGGTPPVDPPTTAPPPTTEPPVTSAPPAVRVKSVAVTALRQTGTATATAAVEVATDGTGPVTITVVWATGDTKGEPGSPDGAAQTFERSGATQYTLTLDHTFKGRGCYWSVRAASDPAAANGSSEQQILTRRCTVQ